METKNQPKQTKKETLLAIADVIDGFLLIPRAFIIMYGYLVYNLYTWYTSIPTHIIEKCDAALIKVLLDHGELLNDAKVLACFVADTTGGPTMEQTAFVTAIVGLSTAVFGFYINAAKKYKTTSTSTSSSEQST